MTDNSVAPKSKKKKQIVEMAETLFLRHGIKRVTIEEICRKSKVSKMTFYKYFSNKAELVKHIWGAWVQEGFDKFDEISAMDISFPEKLELMFDWKKELLSKMSTEFIEDILPISMELQGIRERFFEFIVEAQKKGEVRSEIRPEFIMAVIDKIYELAGNEALMKSYPSIIAFNREIKDFFWFGIYAGSESKRE